MNRKFTTNFIESSGTLSEHWYVACTAEALSKKPIQSIIFDTPIVLWRDKGTPVALLDRCCHRNAALSEGSIIQNSIKCPYHGWKFDHTGQCVNIPSEKDQRICKNFQVQSFHCKESYGLIWLWMGKGEPTEEMFAMPIMANQKGWKHYYMVTEFDNNITDLVENFLDVPHTVYVHKGWFRNEKTIKVPITVERANESVVVSYHRKDDKIGAFSKLINPKNRPVIHTDKFFMPNITRVDYQFGEDCDRAFIITSSCTPISPFKTKVYTLISFKFEWLNPLGSIFLPWYTKKVIMQDVDIMKNQGDNLQIFKEKDYRSTQADTLHIYVESLREWEENGRTSAPPKDQKRECEIWI
jgi:phenylpropionate dioxygenase-like ring-hydroxylating dioxygenase large terminal subunit